MANEPLCTKCGKRPARDRHYYCTRCLSKSSMASRKKTRAKNLEKATNYGEEIALLLAGLEVHGKDAWIKTQLVEQTKALTLLARKSFGHRENLK